MIFLFLASILFKGKGPSRTVGDVLLVSVSGILPLPLHFAVLYCWVGIHYSSEAENIPDLWTAFYFSVVTWTTLGFGDIVPSDAARFIVIAEATMGYVVMALLIAAFVEAIKT